VTTHLTGYIRVTADSIDQARLLLTGNPHFEMRLGDVKTGG
jgi:hypothetical protein